MCRIIKLLESQLDHILLGSPLSEDINSYPHKVDLKGPAIYEKNMPSSQVNYFVS